MKLIKLLLVGILLLPILACNKGKNNSSACNGSSTRRDIKLVIDPDAEDVDTIPIIATVDSLGAMDVIQAKRKPLVRMSKNWFSQLLERLVRLGNTEMVITS